MDDVRVNHLGLDDNRSHMPMMQNVIERPKPMAHEISQESALSRAALWIIDALALELAAEPAKDRKALVEALRRRAGYEQADALWPDAHEALQAELVARLAGRLARD